MLVHIYLGRWLIAAARNSKPGKENLQQRLKTLEKSAGIQTLGRLYEFIPPLLTEKKSRGSFLAPTRI